MTIKRWVTRAAVGTESYRPLVDTNGRLEPDPDEGPFYVLASDHEAEIEALRTQVQELTLICRERHHYMKLMTDRAEQAERDAARYRYLRDATGWSIQQWLGLTGVWTEYLSGRNLDAAIDAELGVNPMAGGLEE